MILWYLVVLASCLVAEIIPIFGPPAWIIMLLLTVTYDLNPWVVLAVGVPAGVLGRHLMSLYVPRWSNRFISAKKCDDLKFLGGKLGQKTWRAWIFVFVYTVLPLSTTALFTAAGMAKVRPLNTLPPFFFAKLICDAALLFAGIYAADNAREILSSALSWKTIAFLVLSLVILGCLMFVDWRQVIERRRLVFHFRIWKRKREPAAVPRRECVKKEPRPRKRALRPGG